MDDLQPYQQQMLARLYGLPAYRSKWLPDQLLVGGPRFGKTLSVNEFRRLYLNDFEDDMPTYDASTTNLYTSSTSSTITYNPVYYSNVSAPKYLVSYGDANWVSPEPAVPAKPKPETDMAWLKRRIAEVSWVPA